MVPALMAVARHEVPALMILMPFRHSKTDLGTLSFLAWLTGVNPNAKNMLLSYSDKFAKRFGRKIVELIRSQNHQEIFPNCVLSPTARSGSYFTTTMGGEFYSAGFSGTITGQGVGPQANVGDLNASKIGGVLVIDDPLKNMEDATSPAVMTSRMEDYESAAGTRLEGGSKVLITNRWCQGDFVDRVLDKEGEVSEGGDWTVLRLPAEAGENDPIGRQPGEYLWPERLGTEWYETHKKKTRLWNAMLQQDPKKNSGKYFKREWLCFYPKQARPGKFPAYMLTDPARSKGKEHDRTCSLVLVATPEHRLLLVDASLGKYDPGERGRECIRLLRKWHPRRWLYEEYGLVSDTWYLEQEAKRAGVHIKPIPVGRKGPRHIMSKQSRIESLIPDFREGRIWLPDIWGDAAAGQAPVEFPSVTLDDGKEQNIIDFFLDTEYLEYAGDGSVPHDEILDCLDRIHEEELQVSWPSASMIEVGRVAERTIRTSRSWEAIW